MAKAVVKEQEAALVDVVLNKPGVKACGNYLAGKVYSVSSQEAKRLTEVKGFTQVTPSQESASNLNEVDKG